MRKKKHSERERLNNAFIFAHTENKKPQNRFQFMF